jgi:hypothetical protein
MNSMAASGLTVYSPTTGNRTLSEIVLVKIDLLFHHAVEGVCSIGRSALCVHARLVHHVLHGLLWLPVIHVAATAVIFMRARALRGFHGLMWGRFPEGRVARILSEIDGPLLEVPNSWSPYRDGVALSPAALEEGSLALTLLRVPLPKHSMRPVVLLIRGVRRTVFIP